ncbi:adenosine deaminase [Kaistia dalseonensis]|uniref:Adenosine deaminase n=1 Tax=Kaistia dalseonensis TaxID=410840 RepID=A0ABU0HCK0_9HYPH|nr:adenosine deaminase [Kaistia dalseonensis]MCX5497406.1 adenosine deaminase [Kaistia dalseonensis]MDQ0440045.1 adenosine deaminase [Kaistia dalseonensis]
MDIETFARKIPKIELHLHLEGAVRPGTFVDLARRNGVALPAFDDVTELYNYDNLPDFLKIYDLVSRSIVTADDFHRITYEMLESCAESGARHVEFFFSAHAHQAHGVTYPTMLSGILAAMHDIEADKDLSSRLIPAHSRELGLKRGLDFLDMVLEHRTDEIIGIGLDYNEAPFPPAPFQVLFERAAEAGLHRTAHAGEGGPAENVRDSLAILGVERIDHGYHIVDDPELVAACREQGTFFTCCPSTTTGTTIWRDLSAPDHAIRQMIDAGLNVTINSDDPPMFLTDLANEFVLCATRMKLDADQLKTCALNSIDASWLDDGVKRDWKRSWTTEIDGMIAELEPAPSAH